MKKLNANLPDSLMAKLDDIAAKTKRNRSQVAASLIAMAAHQWFLEDKIDPTTQASMVDILEKFSD